MHPQSLQDKIAKHTHMTTVLGLVDHHGVFDMDGGEQSFEMVDDYGFYEELDEVAPSDQESSPIPIRGEGENTDGGLLTPSMIDAIAEDGLPWSMQDARWDRLFSSSRDDGTFSTFMRRVRGHGQTVIVAKTSDGRIIGGYCCEVWSGRKKKTADDAGSHHAFLFVVDPPCTTTSTTKGAVSPAAGRHTFIPGLEVLASSPTSASGFDLHHISAPSTPEKCEERKPHVEIFKASHKHTHQTANAGGLKQACQISNKLISMSDGNGDLSLVLENSFSRGRLSHTRYDREEEFTIVEFEVYGFSED